MYLLSLSIVFFNLLVDVAPPAGVERQFLGRDRPAGSQYCAERPEEEQRHQQLQRQPHLDTSTQPAAGCLPALLDHSHRCRTSPLPWLRSKPYHGRVTSLENYGSACSTYGVRVAWWPKNSCGNEWVIRAVSDRTLQMYDSGCCDCSGHVSCSLTSFPSLDTFI